LGAYIPMAYLGGKFGNRLEVNRLEG